MFHGFDYKVITDNLSYLLIDGLGFTLRLTLMAAIGATVLGSLVAVMELSRNRLVSGIAASYVNLTRALPLLLVIFWFYFLIPGVWQWVTGAERPTPVGAFLSALITFTLFEAAYYAESVRSGIQSLGRGQMVAAEALGLRYPQVLAYVILPQALRNMLPVLLMQTIILFQDTSLVYVLSITDFLGAASKIANRDFRLVELYSFAAVIYLVISAALSAFVRRLQSRIAIVR